jgi:hypothetical protein
MRDEVRAKGQADGLYGRALWGGQGPGDLVCVDQSGPQILPHFGNGAFAASNATGQANVNHVEKL